MVETSALKDAYLVTGLKEEEAAQIAAIATVRTYRSGEALTKTGDAAKEVFIILSGNVKVTTDDGDLLGEVGANSVVGEMGLVDSYPANANVTCVGAVCVAAISTLELRRLMGQNRDWGFVILSNISRVMAGRLRQTNARIDELTDLTTEPWQHSLG
ncbi:MAG: Crp/Fnr family transcriptional regulator [Chlorobia bacterium]|nr:Crp/Fnr family transcriptional regulator [Fimbriimonadaceae bacterium]